MTGGIWQKAKNYLHGPDSSEQARSSSDLERVSREASGTGTAQANRPSQARKSSTSGNQPSAQQVQVSVRQKGVLDIAKQMLASTRHVWPWLWQRAGWSTQLSGQIAGLDNPRKVPRGWLHDLPASSCRRSLPNRRSGAAQRAPSKSKMDVHDFFTEYGEANRYQIKEVIGKGSYGVVCSALDNKTGEKVAIKKINNVFDHVSDATRILREIKLLRLLRHPGERAAMPVPSPCG